MAVYQQGIFEGFSRVEPNVDLNVFKETAQEREKWQKKRVFLMNW